MSQIQDTYRTRDGRARFTFRFVEAGGGFFSSSHIEIDIVDAPSYGGRSTSSHDTHRVPSDRGGYKVCIGHEGQVRSLNDARRYARAWAEETWKYITRGETF